MRKRPARERERERRTARGGRRGCPRWASEEDPRGSGARLFDLVVEVEGASTDCACSPDSPEGVVGERKGGVRVQPFSCSGATSGNGPHRNTDEKPRSRNGA